MDVRSQYYQRIGLVGGTAQTVKNLLQSNRPHDLKPLAQKGELRTIDRFVRFFLWQTFLGVRCGEPPPGPISAPPDNLQQKMVARLEQVFLDLKRAALLCNPELFPKGLLGKLGQRVRDNEQSAGSADDTGQTDLDRWSELITEVDISETGLEWMMATYCGLDEEDTDRFSLVFRRLVFLFEELSLDDELASFFTACEFVRCMARTPNNTFDFMTHVENSVRLQDTKLADFLALQNPQSDIWLLLTSFYANQLTTGVPKEILYLYLDAVSAGSGQASLPQIVAAIVLANKRLFQDTPEDLQDTVPQPDLAKTIAEMNPATTQAVLFQYDQVQE